jgi:hypothetical protein
VLTPNFVATLVAEVNTVLTQEEPALYCKIEEAQRRLSEADRSIGVLLDLAEQFGAASAAARLLEREAEQRRLRSELDHLRRQQQTQRLKVSPDAVLEVLAEMRETLASGDMQAKRTLLAKLVVSVEMAKDRGKVSFTFPLSCASLYIMPPGGGGLHKKPHNGVRIDCRTGLIGTWGRSCSTQDPKNGTRGGIVLHPRHTHSRRFFLSGLCPTVGSTQGRSASLIPKMLMRVTIGAHLVHQRWGWQRLLLWGCYPSPHSLRKPG